MDFVFLFSFVFDEMGEMRWGRREMGRSRDGGWRMEKWGIMVVIVD